MSHTDRRTFLQLMGATALATLKANIAKALEIPASHRTGTIRDVEHIVILMQENRPFDHHFGTLRGVRGFSDPRAININLPLQSGTGTTPVPVFLQPAGPANVAAGYGVPPNYGNLGGPADGAFVIPPFRVNPESVSPGLTNLGMTYLPGTDHGWAATHAGWNQGQYDGWAIQNGPMAMSYMTRDDLPYHYALADAFTIADAYHCSIMGPTNPNRCYLWTGCIGNVNYLGAGGTDGLGAGPITYNGLSINNAYLIWQTFPEVLQAAGVSWKIYQDLAGQTFSPDFGDGTGNSFAGNYTDNSMLYFNQYATAAPGSPLFENACTGTEVTNTIPSSMASEQAWEAWTEGLFAEFKSDVQSGKLPQVSWIVGPAGYTEHPDYPIDYGAWYIAQVLDILVSNPEVFSKTVFILNYDEADGSFDHILQPTPPSGPGYGASTVSIENEIVTTDTPNGPIGLGTRVGMIAISPWSKGGYVNSQVFDHTSVIQFIEKRFGVLEGNISPWRRAVTGDLTSVFNFASPNDHQAQLPSTTDFLPSVNELAGGNVNTFVPTQNDVIIGVPTQERGLRPARALPYELNVHASVDPSSSSIELKFFNTGGATVVFQVRSGNPADLVRTYTVEPGKSLADTWNFVSSYHLSVYGPNGFVRFFNGSVGSGAAALGVRSSYAGDGDHQSDDRGTIQWKIVNIATSGAEVSVLDAYSGNVSKQNLRPGETFEDELSLQQFHGWYDLIITVAGDPIFKYRLAGHVETGRDSFSDPALGGVVTLKG
ncbi:MAG TPA: phospholipase C, phosphocholine-specific [Candidatus Acidoferrales bacterium]|jgi:phospholipase C|nr:phospholipase C, phosphocholine-specific [Candidatus Acidoferrales bacterium]